MSVHSRFELRPFPCLIRRVKIGGRNLGEVMGSTLLVRLGVIPQTGLVGTYQHHFLRMCGSGSGLGRYGA